MFDVALMGRLAGSAAPTEDEIAAAREARSREFEYEDRAFESARGVIPPLPSTEQIKALISDEALLKVIEFEVTNEQVYRKRYERPIRPGGASGVTIGIGYDLGYNSTDDVRRDLAGLLSPDNIEALIGCCGLSGEAAATARQRVRDVVLPWDRALALFQRTTVPKFAQLVQATFPNADETAGHAFGALFSLVYNRGPKLTGERRRHMKAIHDLMAARRYEHVPAQFRDMCQLWAGDPAMKGVVKRRIVEAQLFEAGLAQLRARGLVVAAAPSATFERVGGGSVVALADEKAALEHDIGLYETATRRDPAANFESLTGSIVSFGSLALRSIGAPLLQQAEQLLKDQICRGEAELRVGLRTQIDTAARQNLGALKHVLTTVLRTSTFDYLPAALHERIAAYVVDNVIAPNAGQAVQFVEGGIEGLCRQWDERLTARVSQELAERSAITAVPQGIVSRLLTEMERAIAAEPPDVETVKSHLIDLRTQHRSEQGFLGPQDNAKLLDILCDPRLLNHLGLTIGPDPNRLIQELIAINQDATERRVAPDSAVIGAKVKELYSCLADARRPISEPLVESLLRSLRETRRVDDISLLADRFVARDQSLVKVVTPHYALSLIDSGRVGAAIAMLQAVSQNSLPEEIKVEIEGLLGRAHKQIYVDHVRSAGDAVVLGRQFGSHLVAAIKHYESGCDLQRPADRPWHASNYIALLKRAQRDGVVVEGAVCPDVLAKRLVEDLERRNLGAGDHKRLVGLAQAHLALGDLRKSAEYFSQFVQHKETTAFDLNSTIRQLQEVWQLEAGGNGASGLILGMKAALSLRDGGRISLSANERRAIRSIETVEFGEHFERRTPGGRFVPHEYLKRLVRAGDAVVAIRERQSGRDTRGRRKADGTGFLLNPLAFGNVLDPNKSYVLTNAHVVWDPTRNQGAEDNALTPDRAEIVFEGLDNTVALGCRVVWQSPSGLYDACLLELERSVDRIAPLEIGQITDQPAMSNESSSGVPLAIVGHPEGGDLSVGVIGSIDQIQTRLVDMGPRGAPRRGQAEPVYLHYTTPTEPGNSGSPVFEVDSWKVVGLHHAGYDETFGRPKLGGKSGRNFANEGIEIHSIIEKARQELGKRNWW